MTSGFTLPKGSDEASVVRLIKRWAVLAPGKAPFSLSSEVNARWYAKRDNGKVFDLTRFVIVKQDGGYRAVKRHSVPDEVIEEVRHREFVQAIERVIAESELSAGWFNEWTNLIWGGDYANPKRTW